MQIAVLLLLLFLGLALPYWDSAPSALFAQDEGDEADELQYFLPFVFAARYIGTSGGYAPR
ncbi:MAG: hypothetical protein R2867_46340 [Caldilineaceae bacterium]